jgi:hypothetical protein
MSDGCAGRTSVPRCGGSRSARYNRPFVVLCTWRTAYPWSRIASTTSPSHPWVLWATYQTRSGRDACTNCPTVRPWEPLRVRCSVPSRTSDTATP